MRSPRHVVELGDVDTEAVAALVLGAVERKIRLHHHGVDAGDVAAVGHDADADGGVNLVAVDGKRRRQHVADLGRQRFDIADVRDDVLQHGEFVAAEAGDQVGLAHARFQPFGDQAQQIVAHRMAERVVDVLEMIEIEIVHGELVAAAPGAGEFQIEPFEKGRAIGQPGQRVGARQLGDLLGGALFLGDVAEKPDAAEIFLFGAVQRPGVALDDAAVRGLQFLVTLDFRMVVEVADVRREFTFVLHLRRHVFKDRLVHPGMEEFLRHAPQIDEMLVVHGDPVGGVDDQDGVGGTLHRRGQEIVRIGQFVFRALDVGDVGENAFDRHQAAAAVAQRATMACDPPHRTVGPVQAEFGMIRVRLALADRAHAGEYYRQVVAVDQSAPAQRIGEELIGLVAVLPDVL